MDYAIPNKPWPVLFDNAPVMPMVSLEALILLSSFILSTVAYRVNNKHLIATKPAIMATSANDADGSSTKVLYLIRHGTSTANDYMNAIGNQWGDATFYDDVKYIDAPLSPSGHAQAATLLSSHVLDVMQNVELVITSPLTRCLQTWKIGIQPRHNTIPVIVLPWLTERVYTSSDTGQATLQLKQQYPELDWTYMPTDCNWWYDGTNPDDQEWRPSGQGQYYAVPGEPLDVLQQRLEQLDDWIENRPEQVMLVITHWGVLKHWLGIEVDHCQMQRMEWRPRGNTTIDGIIG